MSAHDEAVEAACDGFLDAQRDGRDRIRATIRAYLAHMAAAGWKLTRREATEDMMFAGHEAAKAVRVSGISGMTIDAQMRNKAAREIAAWSAMHDAAPSPEEAL